MAEPSVIETTVGRHAGLVPFRYRSNDWIWGVAVVACSLLVFLTTHKIGLAWFDEGLLLQGISLFQQGRLDCSEFLHYSAQYRLLAMISPESGPNLEVIRLIAVGLRSMTALLIWLISIRLMPRRWALLPVVIFILLPGPLHKAIVPMSICLCLHAMIRALERRTLASGCWLGFSLAFAFSMHIYTGIPTLAGWAVIAWFALEDRTGAGPREGAASPLRWHGAIVISLVVFTLLLADFVWDLSPLTLANHNVALIESVTSGSILRLKGIAAAADAAIVLSIYGVVVATLVAAVALGLSSGGRRLLVFCVWVVGFFNLSKWFVRLDIAHLLQNAPPVWILLGFVMFRLWRQLRRTVMSDDGRASRGVLSIRSVAAAVGFAGFGLGLMTMVFFGVTSPNAYVSGIGSRLFKEMVPLRHPNGIVEVPPWKAEAIGQLEEMIRANSSADDYILVCASPQILYHFTGRRSPVGLPAFTVPAIWAANSEEDVVEQIRAKATKVIVYEDKPIIPLESCRLANLAPELYRLIMTDYDHLGTVLGWQVRILREGGDPPSGTGFGVESG